MGKSRLVYEFAQGLLDGTEPPAVLEGRCVSFGSLVPYLPLRDIVRAHCGVSDADSREATRDAVGRTVRDHALAADAVGCLLRLIGVVDDATALDTLSPEAVKARTFEVLRLLLLKVAARRPLVIVVEDVHWIDRTSEEFLTSLAGRLVASRLMLIATHRPGYRIPWFDRSYATQISLSPLGAADSAQLVRSVTPQQCVDAEAAHAILSRGEGNPFFLEELARTVAEHGPGAHAIPETVHGVIMARIDRLPGIAKQVLQTASVLGREVPSALLRAAWTESASVDAELAELCRLEFLFERPGGDEPSYVFKHALTQDVAYDSLLARSRRDLHLRAARALEALHGDRVNELAATLAYHYTRTDLVQESVTWLTRAAERAARVYANAEAILHLDLAARRLQRLPEGTDRDRWMVQVALQQAHSFYFLGRWRESVDVLLPHEARVARLNDVALTADFAFWLAHMYTRLGDQRRAAECAWRAIEAATSAGDDATRGKAHGVLALDSHWAGTPAEGIAHGLRAVALLETQPDQRWWLGMAHFYLALNHLVLGDFESALAEAARADAVGADIGDPRLQTYAGFGAGWIEILRGNLDAAIGRCRRSLELAPDRVSRAYASLFVAYADLEQGEHAQARERLASLVAEFESFGFLQWQAFAATLLGESWRLLDRLDDADAAVQSGRRIAIRAGYWYAVALSYRIAGRIARDRGATADALSAFRQACDTFDRIGAAFERARTREEIETVRGRPRPGAVI
ncbi:MAG: hypothetical protein DMF88_07255 [Acidobacteria bacterium]|nr:MAG: hypothetical protein DMF88_07255 [Acidobacteriota bacterium]